MENITATQMLTGMEQFDMTVVLINLVAFVAGFVLHVWQKIQSEQITLGQYWTMHVQDSVASIVALITTFVSMIMFNIDAPIYAYFAMAYFGDAVFNKAPINLDITQGAERAAISKRDGSRVVPDGKSQILLIALKYIAVFVVLIHLF